MVKTSVLKLIGFLESIQSVPFLIIRLGLGWVFIIGGIGKLDRMAEMITYFESLSIPLPGLLAPFVALLELLGGVAVLLGYGARLASLLLGFTMMVALLTAKQNEIQGFTSLWNLSEFLYILIFALLATHGPGKFALERVFHRHWQI